MSIFDFSEFDSFYKIYNPLTPYGKIEKSEKKLYFSEHHLKNEYNLISKTIPLLSTDSAKTVSLEYHLKRIPNLNFLANQTFTVTEIFQIKKFLINFKIISEKLPKNISDLFLLKFKSYKLLELLNINNNSETFYLSEKYSCKLAEIRAKIKCFDVELSILKKNRIEGIRSKYSFDFRFQDFIVINESKAINLDDKYFYKESYDSNSVVIKPVYQSEYFTLHHKKAE
ncbi:MAG: hypothetical protein GY756_20630, partial [bacterium]|nr:hypothetical protein [bacterium]